MSNKPVTRHARMRVGLAIAAVVAAVAGMVVVLRTPVDSPVAAAPASRPTHPARDPELLTVHTPPLIVPENLPFSGSQPAADDSVIGVTVGGRHRAYTLEALSGITQHVVNDLLAERPVTVTYCVKSGCVRVFTATNGERLRLAVGGWFDGEGAKQMVLRDAGERYFQESGRAMSDGSPIPYQSMEFKLTTWGEWQKAHPDSDVYTGGGVPLH